MSRVLVTGGAGYIGSTLVRMLLERGYKVKVLDRFFFGVEPIKDIEDKIEIIKDDIRTVSANIFEGIDTVMDLAAICNDAAGELDPQKTIDINYLGRSRIANLAKYSGVKRYILASTCSVYGFQKGILTEKSPVNPLTTYAKANYLAECAVLNLADKNYSVTVLRQATVFGFSHRMRFDLAVNGMVGSYYKFDKLNVLRDGTQWRPFVYVKDTARAFIAVMESESEKVNGEIFNVGSNDLNIQVIELARRVTDGLGKSFSFDWYGDPDKRSYKVSFDKIENVLSYNTKYEISECVKELWDKIKKGDVNFNDPKTRTVNWYRTLIEWNETIKFISKNGEML